TVSRTNPLPAQSPWSGGSRLNWLPPFADRWSTWLRPRKDWTKSGVAALTGVAATASGGGAAAGAFAVPGRLDKLRFTSTARLAAASIEARSTLWLAAARDVTAEESEAVPERRTFRTVSWPTEAAALPEGGAAEAGDIVRTPATSAPTPAIPIARGLIIPTLRL